MTESACRHLLRGVLVAAVATVVQIGPALGDPLEGLRPEHPRVIATDADFARVRKLVAGDKLAKRWHATLHERGEQLMKRPVVIHELRDGVRLLYVSRDVLELVQTLALLHQIEGDDRYPQRIWAEMEAVSRFPDWNPNHFLDVGEMVFAVGLAYDWLYDEWTEDQRSTMREAMVRLALEPSINAFDAGAGWTKTNNNWAQVCNGGLIAAALAIGDEQPVIASRVIENGIPAVRRSMARYAPDGGYEEGAAYWGYGTGYNVFLLAALESSLGHDFGLGEAEGFSQTATFVLQMIGPGGKAFNFADSDATAIRSPALLYLAKRYNDPFVARYASRVNNGSAFDLLWYDPELTARDATPPPLEACYARVGAITMRTAWNDPLAAFVGIKGGQNGVSHGQLDLGSFIYEAEGERWFVDLGRDDYNLPGYFSSGEDGMRWKYYRNRAEGHNTLVVNPGAGPDQPLGAAAPVQLQGTEARVDLSEATGIGAERVFQFNRSTGALQITDRILSEEPANLWWFAHTLAQVRLDEEGRVAHLSQNGRDLLVRINEPPTARFEVLDAKPLASSPNPEGQNPNNGAARMNTSPGTSFVMRGDIPRWGPANPAKAYRKLALQLTVAGDETIQIVISPHQDPTSGENNLHGGE